MSDPDEVVRQCLRGVRGAITDEQYVDAQSRIREAIQNAFDLGWKAAGGSIFDLRQLKESTVRREAVKQTYSIVATNHCTPEAQAHLKTLKPGDALVLVREPTNEFDKNAVAIYAGAHKVGYIPKAKNAVLAQYLDQCGAGFSIEKLIAMDQRPDARAVGGTFKPSPNSAFPQIEVG